MLVFLSGQLQSFSMEVLIWSSEIFYAATNWSEPTGIMGANGNKGANGNNGSSSGNNGGRSTIMGRYYSRETYFVTEKVGKRSHSGKAGSCLLGSFFNLCLCYTVT